MISSVRKTESFRTVIHGLIRRQQIRMLIEVGKVFLSLALIALVAWLLGQCQIKIFVVSESMLGSGDPPLFDLSKLEAPKHWKLVSSKARPGEESNQPYLTEWLRLDGTKLRLLAFDSFDVEQRLSLLNHKWDPDGRARAFDYRLPHEWGRAPDEEPDSTSKAIPIYSSFQGTEVLMPNGGSYFGMVSDRFVVQFLSPDSMGYKDVLRLLHSDGFIEEPLDPTTWWGWFRSHNVEISLTFGLLSSILWMWQITTSGTRAARLPGSSEASDPEVVTAGLRTLIDAHPGIEVSELGDNKWSLVVRGDFEGRHLLSNDSASLRHEFRLRLRDRKAIVVESVKAKTRSSDGKSISRGTENSRIVPMIKIPGGMPPIAPSTEGFRVVLESFEPSDLRYALAYYFQLHGWGWEPRLF